MASSMGLRGCLRSAALSGFTAILTITGCSKPPPQAPPPPDVTVAKVLVKNVQDWDDFTGRLQAVETVEVRPRVSGFIDQVAFAEGKLIKRGDLLFVIDPRPYQADFDRAKAELTRTRTAQELSGTELGRVEKLKISGAVSQEEVDERKSTQAQAQANVAAAQAALQTAQLNLDFTRVTSPIDGRVSRAEVTRGNLVTGGNNGGTLLTRVVSIDPIYLYFEADEAAYLRYTQLAREGSRPSSRDVDNPVQLGLSNEEGWPHEGHMDFVDNQVNPATGTMRGRAVFDNKQGFFTPGLFARLRLLGSGSYDAVLIEDRAVGIDQNKQFVMVLGADSKVEYRPVKLGRLIDNLRVVREGLKPEDIIVVSGLQRVKPGAQVTPTTAEMGAPPKTPEPQAAAAPK